MPSIAAGTILADPPWRYGNWSDAKNGAAASAYTMGTMADHDIAALPVASWAAPDCVLACWGTWPKLDVAMRCIASWGFRHVTAIPWVKYLPCAHGEPAIRRGVGFWSMAASEILLISVRGEPRRTRGDAVVGLIVGEPRVFWRDVPRPTPRVVCASSATGLDVLGR